MIGPAQTNWENQPGQGQVDSMVKEDPCGYSEISMVCPCCGAMMDWSGDQGGFDDDCQCLDFVVLYCHECCEYVGVPV